jgi:hypothetical protein
MAISAAVWVANMGFQVSGKFAFSSIPRESQTNVILHQLSPK